MDRIPKGRSTDISIAFTDLAGAPADPAPDSCQVTVVDDAGATIVAATAADDAGATAPGTFTHTLTPANTAQLNVLTARWTATVAGQAETRETQIEVVGGEYFTIADARRLKTLENTERFPAADILFARDVAADALENACGVAFLPRFRRQTLSGDDSTTIRLDRRRVRALRQITVDGVALTAGELALVIPTASRTLYRAAGWANGVENITVAYEHGFSYPPARVARAVLLLAKRFLIDGPVSDRTIRQSDPSGASEWFVTAGVRGAIFDVPEANAVVRDYGYLDASL